MQLLRNNFIRLIIAPAIFVYVVVCGAMWIVMIVAYVLKGKLSTANIWSASVVVPSSISLVTLLAMTPVYLKVRKAARKTQTEGIQPTGRRH
jgi:hypothetical protein